MGLIGDKEFMENITEQELIRNLTSREVSTKLETNDLDMRDNRAVTPDYIKEEVKKIYDTRVRNTFENRIDDDYCTLENVLEDNNNFLIIADEKITLF